MIILMLAMTAGALVLLTLEGKPIRPMDFSLSREAQLTSIHAALSTEAGIEPDRWKRIKVVYQPNKGRLSPRYGLTGDLVRKFHFVIANGESARDGQIFPSNRWTRQLTCLPRFSPDDASTINICLLAGPDRTEATPRQARHLNALISCLVKHCQIDPKIIWKRH